MIGLMKLFYIYMILMEKKNSYYIFGDLASIVDQPDSEGYSEFIDYVVDVLSGE